MDVMGVLGDPAAAASEESEGTDLVNPDGVGAQHVPSSPDPQQARGTHASMTRHQSRCTGLGSAPQLGGPQPLAAAASQAGRTVRSGASAAPTCNGVSYTARGYARSVLASSHSSSPLACLRARTNAAVWQRSATLPAVIMRYASAYI